MRKVIVLVLGAAACCAGADPVLRFSTYLGGSARDIGPSTAVAADGSIYVAMATNSTDLPVSAGAAQKALAAGTCFGGDPEGGSFPRHCFDIFITKFSPDGAILRTTYLGGSGDDFPCGIQLDRAGNVWVAGTSLSADFPKAKVLGTAAASFAGAFVLELGADLSTLMQSTVVIGSGAAAFTLDAEGNAYLAGRTSSALLPTVNAIQPTRTPGVTYADGFLVKLTPSGTIALATYFGGSGDTGIDSVAVDATGAIVIGGNTEAANLPGGGARYGTRSGTGDGFVAKLAADGRSTQWLRWVGGSASDSLVTMTLDGAGSIVAGGSTASDDFPGQDYSGETGFQIPRGFVMKISADGASILSSRRFGFFVEAMTLDAVGAIWLSGRSGVGTLQPSATALQTTNSGFSGDTYLAKLGDAGPPVWSTYIAGSGNDQGSSLAATVDGVALAGITVSGDFPTNHAAQKALHAGTSSPIPEDTFVMRFAGAPIGPPAFPAEGITNAASYRSGEAAPGSLVSVFGDDLSAVVRPATSLPLPATLGDTTVTINGQAAPLYYVSPSQVNAEIPLETAVGTATVLVRRGGVASAQRQVAIVPVSPGLFVGADGFAAINSPSFALRPGDWVTMYATGLGAVDAGNLVIAPVTVTLGTTPLQVIWAGLAPGYVGLYQVNALVPGGVGGGFQTMPLVVGAGGKSSNAGKVTVDGR